MSIQSISLKPNFHSQGEKHLDDAAAAKRRETTERMRRWRASNAEKNRENDTRCRVYRVAREKFGAEDSPAKALWINEEITRRNAKRRQRDLKLPSRQMPIDEFKPMTESKLSFDNISKGSYSSFYSSSFNTFNSSKRDNGNNDSWLLEHLPSQQVVLSPAQEDFSMSEIPPIKHPLPSHPNRLINLEPRLSLPHNDMISSRALDVLNQFGIKFLTS